MPANALTFTVAVETGSLASSMNQAEQAVANTLKGMTRAAQQEGSRIQNALAGIAQFRELKQGVGEARNEWSKAQAEVARLAAAINATASPTKAMQREFDRAKKAASDASSAFDAQRIALQQLRNNLRTAGIDTSSLAEQQRGLREQLAQSAEKLRQQQRLVAARAIVGLGADPNTAREIARVQAAYERLRQSGTLTASELAKAHLSMTEKIVALKNGTEGWASRLSLVKEQLAKLAVAGAGIGLSAKEAIRFESAMADVRKVVDFPTPKAFEELTADIKAMSREIPIPLEGLAKIAEAGGQMGIAAKDIREFTDVVAKMSTAFKISPDAAGESVGRLMNIFQLTVPQTRLLGDAINFLGNNTNAVERDILEVMNRTGGMAKVFGLANTETAALSTAFLSLGRRPEIASNAINNLMMTLQTAPTREGEFKQALQQIGFTAEQLAADIAKKPQQTLLRFLETLKGLDKQTQANTLVQLFGREYADDIALLVGSLDKYKEILGMVSDKTKYAGSMEKEFAERIKTTEAQLQLAKNAISEAAINLGNAFLPAIVAAAKAVALLMQGIATLADQFPVLSAAAVTALTGLMGFSALRLLWSAIRAGVLSTIQPLLSLVAASGSVSAALGAIAVAARGLMLTPLGLALTAAGLAMAVFSSSASSSVEPLLESANAVGKSRQEMVEKIKVLEGLQKALASSKPGTKEHVEAEQKLAEVLPGANLSLDEQGRVLARVGNPADENAAKLKVYIDELKKEDRQNLALQLDLQTRAFREAKIEMFGYTEGLKSRYGIGTDQAQSATQRFLLWMDKLTGSYDSNIAKGAELRRRLGDTEGGMKALLEEARKAGMSVEDLGKAMDGIHADPAVKDKVIDLYRTMVAEVAAAEGKMASLNDRLKQFSIGMAGPAAAAKKVFVEAISVADSQLSNINERLSQHRQKLQQAVDNESRSWKALADVAASSSKSTTERIGEEYDKRRNQLENLTDSGLISERRKVQEATQLSIQESTVKLNEARRYQTEALSLVEREYQSKMEHARRLEQDATRVDEEMLQAKKRVLEQTEAAYRSSIDRLIGEERRHLEAARQINEQRVAFRMSAEERMANLAEKLMTPYQQYLYREQQYNEAVAKGREALMAGNYESARKYGEKAMSLAERVAEAAQSAFKNPYVAGDGVVDAMNKLDSASKLVDQSYAGQEKMHRQSAADLRKEYEGLTSQLDHVRSQLDALGRDLARDNRIILDADISKVLEAANQIDDLLLRKERVIKIKAELQNEANFLEEIPGKLSQGMVGAVNDGMGKLAEVLARFKSELSGFEPEIKAKFDATAATATIDGLISKFADLQGELKLGSSFQVNAEATQALDALGQVTAGVNALDGRVITYTVRQVTEEGYAVGGPVGLARGGSLPGFGGGDRIRALLEAGEFVVRKEAVRKYGVGLLDTINRMRWPTPELPGFATGGLVRNLFIPPVPAFATGGLVAGATDTVNINLSFGGRESFPVQTGRHIADQLVRYLQEQQRGR
ncbi:MAG: phage tail tape measure protein [Magnetococcales bacterium]|nr:phage tail tape measure protein [Magnetococcales bacterium]